MNAAYLLDVNVLLALAWPTNVNHRYAQRWFRDHMKAGWATCPITQAGFVRLSSNRFVTEDALRPTATISVLESNLKSPYHEFWADTLTLPEAVALFHNRISGHGQITDAYLLGLAMQRKARLVTFDRRISSLLPTGTRKSDCIVELSARVS
ncbi:MAG TPA: TA system VapC family ribonuclease toxin [Silvibacterium sp.]|nr:TA system VapC family ribonuclease toxin [Silvibacterium sp.]